MSRYVDDLASRPAWLGIAQRASTMGRARLPKPTEAPRHAAVLTTAKPSEEVTDVGRAGVALTPTAAWSRRVRWIGGLIQAAFAAFWLVRGSAVIGGAVADVLIAAFGVIAVAAFLYAVTATRGTAPRPRGPEGRRIGLDVTIATVIEFAAAIVLPVIVSAAGHSDWVLPSIAITIGPLLLWLGSRVEIPRYRPIGWVITVGPLILVATMSGTPLVAMTGIAAGLLLLGTAAAGFHDLAGLRHAAERAKTSELSSLLSAGAQL